MKFMCSTFIELKKIDQNKLNWQFLDKEINHAHWRFLESPNMYCLPEDQFGNYIVRGPGIYATTIFFHIDRIIWLWCVGKYLTEVDPTNTNISRIKEVIKYCIDECHKIKFTRKADKLEYLRKEFYIIFEYDTFYEIDREIAPYLYKFGIHDAKTKAYLNVEFRKQLDHILDMIVDPAYNVEKYIEDCFK